MRRLFFYLIFGVLALTVNGQQKINLSFYAIEDIDNLDSLEATPQLVKTNALQSFMNVARLEYSRLRWVSSNIGKNEGTLDSLAKLCNYPQVNAIHYYLHEQFLSVKSNASKNEIFDCLTKALNVFSTLKDTLGMLACYTELIAKNSRKAEPISLGATDEKKMKNIANYLQIITTLCKNSSNIYYQYFYFYNWALYYNNSLKEGNIIVDICDSFLQKSYKEKFKLLNNHRLKILVNKAFYYFVFDEYDNFYKTIDEIKRFKIPSKTAFLVPTIIRVASSYQVNRNYKLCKVFIDSAIKLSSYYVAKAPYSDAFFGIYDIYSDMYFDQDDYKNGYEMHKKTDSVLHGLAVMQRQEQLNEIQEKYKADQKVEEAKIATKQKHTFQIVSLIAVFFVLILLIMSFFLRKLNRNLKESNLFREKVLSIISHDLQSPLTALQDLNSQASYYLRKNEIQKFQTLAVGIDKASITISNLLNNLLLWSLAVNKKKLVQKCSISLAFDNVLSVYANIIEMNNIIVVKHNLISENIRANQNIVELILRNWIDNILKYSKANSVSIAAIKLVDSDVQIIIDDNGIMTHENLTTIRQQLNNPANIIFENSRGLGLELIAYFIQKEGWKIDISITNNTTRFQLLIPQ